MTNDEIKWLKQVKKYPNRFQIQIDNGAIWVDDIIESECKFTFGNYGTDFIYGLLNQLGYKADYC